MRLGARQLPGGDTIENGEVCGNMGPSFFFFFFFGFFIFSRAVPAAYGGSQARGLIGAVAAGLCHSHSNARSKLRL